MRKEKMLETKGDALLALVKKDGSMLARVKAEDQTPEICLSACKQDGMALQFVRNEEALTEVLLKAAVAQNAKAIYLIKDKEKRTEGVCLALVSNPLNNELSSSLEFLNEDERTNAVCLAALESYASAKGIPKEIFKENPDIAEIAVKKNAGNIRDIPDEFKTAELCALVIEKNPESLHLVPEEKRTAELCKKAVQKNGAMLEHVPKEIQKKHSEITEAAVKQNGYNIQFAKEQTEELCALAVKSKPQALKYIEKPSVDACIIAIRKDPATLEVILPSGQQNQRANTIGNFESNVKYICEKHGFDGIEAAGILSQAMNDNKRNELKEHLAQLKEKTGKTIDNIAQDWQLEASGYKPPEQKQTTHEKARGGYSGYGR